MNLHRMDDEYHPMTMTNEHVSSPDLSEAAQTANPEIYQAEG
jgi:hypothetical protein